MLDAGKADAKVHRRLQPNASWHLTSLCHAQLKLTSIASSKAGAELHHCTPFAMLHSIYSLSCNDHVCCILRRKKNQRKTLNLSEMVDGERCTETQ